MTTPANPSHLEPLIAESNAVVAAIQSAVRDTLIEHKRAGLPIVEWRDGRIEWVPAEAIVVDGVASAAPTES